MQTSGHLSGHVSKDGDKPREGKPNAQDEPLEQRLARIIEEMESVIQPDVVVEK